MPNTCVTHAPVPGLPLARKQSDLSPWPHALSVALPDTVSEIQSMVTALGPPVSVQLSTEMADPVVGVFRSGVGDGSQVGVKSTTLNGLLLPVAGPGAKARTGP